MYLDASQVLLALSSALIGVAIPDFHNSKRDLARLSKVRRTARLALPPQPVLGVGLARAGATLQGAPYGPSHTTVHTPFTSPCTPLESA
jgi:hypothetical protein